jgi:hypothetical protein
MPLYGNRYVQSGDPSGTGGFIGVGSQWQDTTSGKLYERTSDNTAWKLIYVVDQDRGGLLPVTGGSVTGAIVGTTGWAPVDSPNFNTSAKLGGIDIATVNYVNSIATGLSDSISAQISQAVASTVGNTQINANIAKQKGTFAPTLSSVQSMTIPPDFAAIPLPQYPNGGSQAQESECVWIASPSEMYEASTPNKGLFTADANDEGKDFRVIQRFYVPDSANAPRIYKHYWLTYETLSGSQSIREGYLAAGMNYLIFGVKSTS